MLATSATDNVAMVPRRDHASTTVKRSNGRWLGAVDTVNRSRFSSDAARIGVEDATQLVPRAVFVGCGAGMIGRPEGQRQGWDRWRGRRRNQIAGNCLTL